MDPFTAAQGGDKIMIQRYIDKATEADICDEHGFSLVHWAAWNNHGELLALLKDNKFDMKRQNNGGDTALHIAASKGYLKLTSLLLDMGLDVNAQNEHGNTPLHYAVLWGHLDIAKLLIGQGAEIGRLNKYGESPMKRAGRMTKELEEFSIECGSYTQEVEYTDNHEYGASLATIAMRHACLVLNENMIQITNCLRDGTRGSTYMGIFKNQQVVVKTLAGSGDLTETNLEEFIEEVERLRTLQPTHANVLSILGIIKLSEPVKNDIKIVTQYAPLGSLYNVVVDAEIKFTSRLRLHIALDIIKAMMYLHQILPPLLFYHLKSTSVMVDQRLNAMVNMGDTGFSFNSMARLCEYSPQWMAPEVLEDPSVQGPKSDVYSFGIVLNELHSEQHPFQGMNKMACGLKILYDEKRPDIEEDVPKAIKDICNSCWKTNPDSRPCFADLLTIFETMYF